MRKEFMKNMHNVLNVICDRYITLLQTKSFGIGDHSSDHLIKMCLLIKENADSWPIDKSNRWLGYIQGVMTVYGAITVDEERDFTRPLFHAYYAEQGLKDVPSVSVK
jgi:hypothetical protein